MRGGTVIFLADVTQLFFSLLVLLGIILFLWILWDLLRIDRLIWDFKEVIQWARDRYWFYYVIDGDEFHPSLNLNMKKIMAAGNNWEKRYYKESRRILRDRARAHKLDAIYNGYSKGMVL